jgi:hypothetical protein
MLEVHLESESPQIERRDLLGIFTVSLKVRVLIVAVCFTRVPEPSGQWEGEEADEDKSIWQRVLMATG